MRPEDYQHLTAIENPGTRDLVERVYRLRDRSTHLATEAAVEEVQEAKQAGQIGYLGRILVQATLPHSDPKTSVFERTNAHRMTLRITALSDAGLPWGATPRLLLLWMSTEAVRTKDPVLHLGHSINEYLDKLGFADTGGARGSRSRLRNHLARLLKSAITVTYSDPSVDTFAAVMVADEAMLWWDPKRPQERSLWGSTITLTDRFFREITTNPVPVNTAVIAQLRQSPLALDIYAWLTWRVSFLREAKTIPWEYLEGQFGAAYTRQRAFSEKFRNALAKVCRAYPDVRCESTSGGLIIKPSPTSIARRPSRRR